MTHIHEQLFGVVSEVIGDQVEVTYETPDGPLKQIYKRSQFRGDKLPNEGDDAVAITSVIFSMPPACVVPKTSDIPSFEGRGIKGQLRI